VCVCALTHTHTHSYVYEGFFFRSNDFIVFFSISVYVAFSSTGNKYIYIYIYATNDILFFILFLFVGFSKRIFWNRLSAYSRRSQPRRFVGYSHRTLPTYNRFLSSFTFHLIIEFNMHDIIKCKRVSISFRLLYRGSGANHAKHYSNWIKYIIHTKCILLFWNDSMARTIWTIFFCKLKICQLKVKIGRVCGKSKTAKVWTL